MYMTKQKKEILKILKKKQNEFTVKDIYDELNNDVGLTTVYRFIEYLKKNGKLITRVDDNTIYYQYVNSCDNDNHFYLKCEKCGVLKHVDCDCINELNKHISKEHDFKFNKNKIIINGICKNCMN